MGFPVALKIISPQILHKSDVGGVALRLKSPAELRSAMDTMLAQVARLRPEAVVQGFTVQAMAERPGARELIIGINTDPLFGPVLLLGEGGTAVELRSSHAVALPPLNAQLAQDLKERSRLSPLLAGYRGQTAANAAALTDTLLKVSLLACAILGEVRAVCDPDDQRADFAIQVATDWQGRGLGRLLLGKLLAYLKARGTVEVVGEAFLENTRMAALAWHAGFELSPGQAPDMLTLRLPLHTKSVSTEESGHRDTG